MLTSVHAAMARTQFSYLYNSIKQNIHIILTTSVYNHPFRLLIGSISKRKQNIEAFEPLREQEHQKTGDDVQESSKDFLPGRDYTEPNRVNFTSHLHILGRFHRELGRGWQQGLGRAIKFFEPSRIR